MTNPTVGFLGWFLGVLSFFLAIYFYRKQRVRHSLAYDIVHQIILAPTRIGDTQILANFAGHNCPSLTQSFVFLRNIGNQPVLGEQLLGGVNLTTKGLILGGEVLHSDSAASGAALHVAGTNSAQLKLALLRPEESITFSVLHSDPDLTLDVWAEGVHFNNLTYKRARVADDNHSSLLDWVGIALLAAFVILVFLIPKNEPIPEGIATIIRMVFRAGLAWIIVKVAYHLYYGNGSRAERKFVKLAKAMRQAK